MLIKSRQLHGKIDFNGLQVSIETGRSRVREWHNPHDGTSGMRRMMVPYGYIRGTLSPADGEPIDCFVGPDTTAPTVYIVTTMQSPDFTEIDEQKAILGVRTAEEAERIFHASYDDPRFFGTMTEMPFDEFKQSVLATKDDPKLLAGNLVKARRFYMLPKLRKSQLSLFGTHHIEYTRVNRNGTASRIKAKGVPTTQGALDFNAPIAAPQPVEPPK
jgi:hypothetical protein